MPRRLMEHVYRHPGRLAATLMAITVVIWGTAVWSVWRATDLAHQGRVENCRAVNELSRKIYITASDLGVPMHDRLKFLPMQDCETLP